MAQAPRYDASQLTCATFDVRVTTDVTTELQGRRQVETIRREGRLSVQGTAADGGIAIEAWWDSLSLWRRSAGDTLRPDADGLLGGRYRGLLTPDGRFTRWAAPWVPDEVAEVSDLSVALDDLFPVLSVGTIRRLGDSLEVRRYHLAAASSTNAPATAERPFAVLESGQSEGVLGWGREGLVSWTRTIRSETRVEESPHRAFRSQLTQRVALRRVGACSDR